jgi:hypothetical protein
MISTNAALRAALLVSLVFTACEGRRVLRRGDEADAGPGGPASRHEAPDAASGRADAALDAGEAPSGRADGPVETGDASGEQIPAPADDCAQLHIQYGPYAATGECPTIDCHCDVAYAGPLPAQGHCVTSVDCAAVCATGDLWFTCAFFGCGSDSDCRYVGGLCVKSPGAIEGICQIPPVVPPPCASDLECPGGRRCVAIKDDGSRTCVETATNDGGPCNQDADCPAGHCALPGSSIVGMCSTGANNASCFTDANCASGLHCRNGLVSPPGTCSDGSNHSTCDRDSDCQRGVCLGADCSFGEVGDDCRKNVDCQSGFCAFGTKCSDGAVDAYCGAADQCASGRCAKGAETSACTTGARASKCIHDYDCVSGTCRHQPGSDVTNDFGACD